MKKTSPVRNIVYFVLILVSLSFLVSVYRVVEGQYISKKEYLRSGDNVTTKLGEMMVLPSAQPTIATIVDIEKLKQQSEIFKTAKNGDTVIVYPDRVIIFDTSSNRIVNMGLSDKIDTTASGPASPLNNTAFKLRPHARVQ